MSLVIIFFTALMVGYSGALVPGPMFTLVVAKSAENGKWAGALICAGHALLETVVLVGLAVGLTRVLSMSLVTACISIVGGLFMIFMGVDMITRVVRNRLSLGSAGTPAGPEKTACRVGAQTGAVSPQVGLHLAGLGALVSLSNPYFPLWWGTIGSAYFVSAALYGVPGVLAFFAGHIAADFTWFGIVGCVVAYGRRFAGLRVYRGLIAACGVALVGVAVYFVGRGIAAL